MNKKLFTQIKNEWHSNLWIATELLLVSVVMWYVVDYIYVQYKVYTEPRGFDISNCYLVSMGQLTDKSPDFIPNDTLIAEEIDELVNRIARRPEVEAVSLSQNSYPYNGSNSGTEVRYDTLQSYGYVVPVCDTGFLESVSLSGDKERLRNSWQRCLRKRISWHRIICMNGNTA